MKPVRLKVGPTRKLPIWEKAKKEKRKNRIIRIAFLLIVLIILVNVAIRVPTIYHVLSHPFERLPNDKEKLADLDTSFRTNLLLASYEKERGLGDLAIASYEPADRRLTVLFFDLSENRKLQMMANHVFEKEGVVGLQRFISMQTAVPVDRYLAFESSDLTFTTESMLNSYKEIKSANFFLKVLSFKRSLNKTLKTNLTSAEILNLIWRIRGAKFEEKDQLYLNKIGSGDLASRETTEELSNLFVDRKISDEGAAVTVRNSSGKAGLGTVLARYLGNLGVTIVAVETGEESSQKNFLLEKNSKPQLEKRLASIISFNKKKAEKEDFSGDILIIVGEEAIRMLTLP